MCWAVAHEACFLNLVSTLRVGDAQLLLGKRGLSSRPRIGEDETAEKLLEAFSQGH